MNLSKAKKLLSIDISKMSLEALQKQYVSLLDAWRYAKGDYGHDNTFFAYCAEMRGFVPADYWVEKNLATRLSEIEKILSKMYAETAETISGIGAQGGGKTAQKIGAQSAKA